MAFALAHSQTICAAGTLSALGEHDLNENIELDKGVADQWIHGSRSLLSSKGRS
jgi:hypothetical protein